MIEGQEIMFGSNNFLVSVLILVFATTSSSTVHSLESMTVLFKNLLTLGGTELNFISDFTVPVQSELLNNLNEMGIPQYVYEIDGWRYKQTHIPKEPCPIFGEGNIVRFSFRCTAAVLSVS